MSESTATKAAPQGPKAGRKPKPRHLSIRLKIDDCRGSNTYRVFPVPSPDPGRVLAAVKFSKVGPSTGPMATYTVYLPAHPEEQAYCDCPGNQGHGHCKHAAAAGCIARCSTCSPRGRRRRPPGADTPDGKSPRRGRG